MTDIESLAAGLTSNMVKSLTWWCHEGTISSDVDDSTRRAVVRRKLGEWSSGQCVDLTELGQQVREVLLAKQKAEEEAETRALANRAAHQREIRLDGYVAGQQQQALSCAHDLYRAIYGNDSWPDRPLDTIWNHLIEQVGKKFQAKETA